MVRFRDSQAATELGQVCIGFPLPNTKGENHRFAMTSAAEVSVLGQYGLPGRVLTRKNRTRQNKHSYAVVRKL